MKAQTLKYFSLYVILLFSLMSCTSDDDSHENEPIAEKKIWVKSINENDLNDYEVNYNDQGRIASVVVTGNTNNTLQYSYNTQGKLTQKGDITYQYNPQGKISKIINPQYVTEVTYNQQGQPVSEETTANTYSFSKTFSYSSEGLLSEVTEHYTNLSLAEPFIKYHFSYDTAGNITKIIQEGSGDGITYNEYSETKIIYDDKNNPLLNLHQNSGGEEGISFEMGAVSKSGVALFNDNPKYYFYGKNNILSYVASKISTGDLIYKYTFTYQYSEDGYPISVNKELYNPSGPDYTIKYRWRYAEE